MLVLLLIAVSLVSKAEEPDLNAIHKSSNWCKRLEKEYTAEKCKCLPEENKHAWNCDWQMKLIYKTCPLDQSMNIMR